jgi:predicted nuclease of predicted toxin-antitoxin system
MRFLIDECLSPSLASLAHDRGLEAYHVAHRGWSAVKDPQQLSERIGQLKMRSGDGKLYETSSLRERPHSITWIHFASLNWSRRDLAII